MSNPVALTDEQVAAIRARLDKADWGPWKVYRHPLELSEAGRRHFPGDYVAHENRIGQAFDHPQLHAPLPIVVPTSRPFCTEPQGIHISDDNAELIANAPTDLHALLTDRDRLTREAAVARAHHALERLQLRQATERAQLAESDVARLTQRVRELEAERGTGCLGFGSGGVGINEGGRPTATYKPGCPRCRGAGFITILCPGPSQVVTPQAFPLRGTGAP